MFKRHTKKNVGAPLVQLAGEPAVDHVKLEHRVARGQRHLRQVRDIPGRDDQSPRIGILADLGDQVRDLVDAAAVGCPPRSPLGAINRSEIALVVGPFVPDAYPVLL